MHRTTLTDLDETAVATRAARGERPAFDELHHRHGPVAWRLAVVASTGTAQAEHALAEGLARTVANLTAAPSTHPLRLDLLAATRAAGIAGSSDDERSAGTPDGWPPAPVDADAGELRLLGAYRSLPEHYRSTLWLLESERLETHHAGRVLGLPSDAVGLLHLRARGGLRQALSARQLEDLAAEEHQGACQRATRSLGASRTGRLGAADRRAVDRHLERCAPCRARLAELDAAPTALRAVVEVPVLPGPDAAWARFQALTAAAEVRPLGLLLPGGRPVPLWAERALAGAAAAAVSLGIAGAIALGARGEPGPGQGRAPEVATQAGTAGSGQEPRSGVARTEAVPATPLEPVVLDAAPPPPTLGGGAGSRPVPGGGAQPTDQVRGTAGTSPATPAPSTVADPAPEQPAPEQPANSGPPRSEAPADEPSTAPTDPAPSDPTGQLDVDLGDLGVSIGESCTGVRLGTATLGCDSAGTTDAGGGLQVGDTTVPLPGLGG